jgi:hypothetical protein
MDGTGRGARGQQGAIVMESPATIIVLLVIAGCCVFVAAVQIAHLWRGLSHDDWSGDR